MDVHITTIVIINDHDAFFVLTWSKFSSQPADPNTVPANQCTKLSWMEINNDLAED